jgi:hypothetical protein
VLGAGDFLFEGSVVEFGIDARVVSPYFFDRERRIRVGKLSSGTVKRSGDRDCLECHRRLLVVAELLLVGNSTEGV